MKIQDAIKHIKSKEITAKMDNNNLILSGNINYQTKEIINDFEKELYIVAATRDILREKTREVFDKTSEDVERDNNKIVRPESERDTGQIDNITGKPNRLF